jgi:hypothetical protein
MQSLQELVGSAASLKQRLGMKMSSLFAVCNMVSPGKASTSRPSIFINMEIPPIFRYSATIASNLHFALQFPHLMQASPSIR